MTTMLQKIRERASAMMPDDSFWIDAVNKADGEFKGHFVTPQKKEFALGCAFGYGAARADYKALIEALIQAVEEAEKGLEFYASRESWGCSDWSRDIIAHIDIEPTGATGSNEPDDYLGGKRAREARASMQSILEKAVGK